MAVIRKAEQPVNPSMIVLARDSRRMTQKELAERLGITQGFLSKMEHDIHPVSEEHLEALSKTLHYPKQFFYQQQPLMGVGVAELFHRKRQDVPQKDLSQVYATVEIRARHVAALLQAVDIPRDIRRFPVDSYEGGAEDIARIVRAAWNVPRGPITDLTQVVENQGILVVPCDFPTSRIDAISRWHPQLPPIFFVNQAIPKDRYRFSLAHELGHILMHELPNPEIELQADAFACEFLMPERDIRQDLAELDLAEAGSTQALLARVYGLSIKACA